MSTYLICTVISVAVVLGSICGAYWLLERIANSNTQFSTTKKGES